MESTKTYWKGLEELNNNPEFIKNSMKEFPEFSSKELNVNSDSVLEDGNNRRDFLKFLGFSVAAASLAACETPVKKAIPYLIKPEEVDPTNANWYASSYVDGSDYASILVKTREGRPIKIEGNKKSTVSTGGTSVRAQASVLGLYDGERLRSFKEKDSDIATNVADGKIISRLKEVASSGKSVYVVTSTVLSPTLNAAIFEFSSKYAAKVVAVDPVSAYGIIKANESSFGLAALPTYDFSKAKTIVSIGADFLGTWISSTEFSKQYSKTRKISEKNPEMSKHFQFESILSLTGANADYRTMIKPSQEGLVVANLYNLVAEKLNASTISVADLPELPNLKLAAAELVSTKGASLVVSGSNDPAVQVIVNALNSLLGSYGVTIDTTRTANYKSGNDTAFETFVSNVKAGEVGAVIFYNSNPVYSSSLGKDLAANLSKVSLKVSLSDRLDETASLCDFTTPDHHYLESWSDAEPKSGSFSLVQPTITPLFKTRAALESFLVWSESSVTDSYTYLTKYWKSNLFSKQSKYADFQTFWDKSLYDGVFELPASGLIRSFSGDISAAATSISKNYKAKSDGLELVIYEKTGMGDGANGVANNPWILEFPDPITKATWENYLTIPISLAKKLGIKMEFGNTKKVTLKVNGISLTVPVLVQPGQAPNTVGLAVGYGREKVGKAGNGKGVNAYPFVSYIEGIASYSAKIDGELVVTEEAYQIGQTQTHQTIMGRDIVQESTLSEYKKDPKAGRYFPTVATAEGVVDATTLSMWKMRERTNHSWGMVIDLNACTGCGICVVSCQAENNVPVVGKQEIINSREMHWIRIDRYYTSDTTHESAEKDGVGVVDMYTSMEDPSENPKVVFQPMMCQHCNNAPCETVCPVLATTHSSEGINQMTYNRCIGTRYCANNCPYKVRRFNWFRYAENEDFNFNASSDLGKMVLNPDVTVRARGVMEKCSMCVQRIQEGKLNAKKNNRRPIDGEIETACSQSCPADAIVFGDMNDKDSNIAKLIDQEYKKRQYFVLEEINVMPSVSYLTKIRNTEA